MSYHYYLIYGFEAPISIVEAILADLHRHRCLGVERQAVSTEKESIRAYFEAQPENEIYLRDLESRFGLGAHSQITPIGLPKQQDAEHYFEPFALVGDFWLCSSRPGAEHALVPATAKKIPLSLGPAFGTGRHPTTRLCAQLIADLSPVPESLLDVGTGSGILALLAKYLGIAHVDAVEISREARENAQKNFEENGFAEIRLEDDLSPLPGPYSVVAANLLTPTLLHLKDALNERLGAGGRLLLSGICRGEEASILEAFPHYSVERQLEAENWWGLCLVKPGFF